MGRGQQWYWKQTTERNCTTHGHELRGGNAGGLGSAGWRGNKEGKIGKLTAN